LNSEDIEITEAYATADLEFTAFAIAYANPRVKIVNMKPMHDDARFNRDGRKANRYMFHLIGQSGEDVREQLQVLLNNYVSGETVVEPQRLLMARRQLSSRIRNEDRDREGTQGARRGSRRGGGRAKRRAAQRESGNAPQEGQSHG